MCSSLKREMKTLVLPAVFILLAQAKAGVQGVRIDTSADRVESPLALNLTRVGTIRPRAVSEIRDSNWTVGCETLDRDFADFEEYKDRLSEKDKKYYEDYLASLNAVSDDVKAKYLSKGGSFSIDGNYTIFGQCIEGFEFIDKISQVEVSSGNDIDDKQGIDSKPTVSITIKKIAIARIPYIDETTTTAKKKPSRPAQTTVSSSDENSSDAPSQSDDSAVIITPETTTVADSESEAPESSTEEESSEAEQ